MNGTNVSASQRLFIGLSLLILLVGMVLRMWQLSVYPPGPHYDEAVEVLITRSIAFGGANLFPIVNSYQGREALFYYLSAPFFHLIADNVFTLRVVNAFANLLTMAASIGLGRAMFGGRRGWIIGLAIGVMFAISFPQIWMSRQAFRTPVLPLCQAMALWCLWRGLNTRRMGWGWVASGGFFAGAALYTYMASRLFPMWLGIGGLALVVMDSGQRVWRIRQGVVFFGALVVTALPMALYALKNPEIFLQRLTEVGPGAGTISLFNSVIIHARMFFIDGEGYYRYNIPGRPYLTWIEGVFLMVGIGVCLIRAVRMGKGSERAGYLVALLSPFMVLPSVVSVGGLPPNHMRSVGMVPLIFVLTAVGIEWSYDQIVKRSGHVSWQGTAALLTAGAVIIGGWSVGREYFSWASRTDVYVESDGDLDAAAKWLLIHAKGERVYIATRYREHPTVLIQHVPNVVWLGTDSLFRPTDGETAWVIIPRSVQIPAHWLAWLEPMLDRDVPIGPDGLPAFAAYRLRSDVSLPYTDDTAPERWENATLQLAGRRMPVIFPGGREWVELAWIITQMPTYNDLTPIIQVEDATGDVLSRSTADFIQTDRWLSGEMLMHRMPVSIPVGTPPGLYTVQAGWVSRGSDQYLPYFSSDGRQGGIWAEVGTVEVIRPATFPSPDELDIAVRDVRDVTDGVRFLGYNLPPARVRPGEVLPMTLFWQGISYSIDTTERRMSTIYRILLRDGNGQDTLLWTGSPVQGRYNSTQWADGELVTDRARWIVPREQVGGKYTLVIEVGAELIALGEVEVIGTARQMDATAVDVLSGARLGDNFALYGYNVDGSTTALTLELEWQLVKETPISYTVFVHVVDSNGQIVAQRDAAPNENGYPTQLWQVGEYIHDVYRFEGLSAGTYTIQVGLYNAQTGARLPVAINNEPGGDAIDLGAMVIEETGDG